MSTHFDKLKEIFLVAVEKGSAAERAEFLDQACAGNALLRSRLEALLEANESSGDLLDRAPFGPVATAQFEPIQEQPGSIIGPYKLLQQIGEGGMGLVFMAEQQRPVKRKVALKIIKPGMNSKQVVARFEAERQALALMNHPHIAQVFDAGETGSGRPYFVMELVRGVPITDYCDQNNLTPRERLELFVPVCLAVQHAHQKGVIHRDLKPTNVLVTLHDGRPVPKVIDFGVSKAIHQELTERTLFTNFAQMVGTPLYMSPEQAEMSGLDVDTRADIYSLGVLLYELLTGQTPFDRKRLHEAAFDEIRRIIREEEPPRPSTRLSTLGEALTAVSSHRKTDPRKLSQLIRGDLDWIVMKSLEKDRTRRYGTASEFAADIERHLHDEPVIAGPPSMTYKLGKFARKHRGAVAAASAVVAALALGLTVSLFLYARSEGLRSEAEDSKLMAMEAREAALLKAGELQAAMREVVAERDLKNDALTAKDAALRRSEALRLTTHSTNVLPQNPGLALLLAIEAAQRGPRMAPANNALLAALAECREVRTLVPRPPFSEHEPAPLAVTDVLYSGDGSRLVTLAGGTIHQWVTLNTRTDLFGTFIGPETMRSKLRLEVGTLHVWDAATGRLLRTIHAPPNLRFATVAISPNGQVLAATFGGSTLIKYAGGETHLYTDRVARLYDVESGRELHTLRGHTDHIAAAVFSPDSRRLLTASADKTARLWDIATGEQVPNFLVESAASLDAAEFSPDGRHILTLARGMDQGKHYVDDPEHNDPNKANWKIDPPAGERQAVRAVEFGEYGNWSTHWTASFALLQANGQVSRGVRPGVRLWDAESGAAIAEPPKSASSDTHDDEDATVANFSHDGGRVITASSKGTVVVRTVDDPRETLRFSPRSEIGIRSIEFSRDDRRLLVCFDDDQMAIHDSETGEIVSRPSDPAARFHAAWFNGDGRQVLVKRARREGDSSHSDSARPAPMSETGEIAVLEVENLRQLGGFHGHSDEMTAGCLSPDGRSFATGSRDGTARIWAMTGPAPLGAEVAVNHAPSVRVGEWAPMRVVPAAAVLSHDGRLAFAADVEAYRRGEAEQFARVIEVPTGKVVSKLVPDRAGDKLFFKQGLGGIAVAQFSPDLKRLLTVSHDSHVRVIKPGTSSTTLFATASEEWPIAETLPFSPVRVWDIATGRELFHIADLRYRVDWASFSPDGRRILSRSTSREDFCYVQPEDGKVVSYGNQPVAHSGGFLHIWDADDGRLLWEFRDTLNPRHEWESSVTWGPGNQAFATARLFGWVDFEHQMLTMVGGVSSADELSFAPDWRHLLAKNSDQATLFEITQPRGSGGVQEQYELVEHRLNGERVGVFPRRVDTNAKQVPLKGSTSSIVTAAFSNDGRWLAAAMADHGVQVWDVSTGGLRYVLRGHTRPASHVLFSPDGQWLVTASDDRTARVWDVAAGIEFVTLQTHTTSVPTAVFSADGRSVITSSADGTVRTFPVDPLEIALRRMPRELTPEELARFEVRERGSDSD